MKLEHLRQKKPVKKTSIELTSFVFFDIETTGLRPDKGAKITEVAILNRNTTILKWKADKELTSTTLKKELPKILENLENGVVIGHNLSFDLWFISYEANKIGLAGPNIYFIDTLSLSRKILKKKESYKLESLLNLFQISVASKLHTAIIDAEATRVLFWKLIEKGGISTVGEAGIKQLNWSSF